MLKKIIKDKDQELSFKDCIINSHPTGSRYICNPPVLTTDKDTAILVDGFEDYQSLLAKEGWDMSNDGYAVDGYFTSWRKGEENYILIEDEKYYDAFIVATEAAKALNLLDKADRITLFESVIDSMMGWEDLQI